MDNEVACVDERPFAAVAFGAEDFETGFFQIDGNVVRQCFNLACAVAAGNNHAGKQGGFVLGFQNRDVFGFNILEGVYGHFDHFLQVLQFLFVHCFPS